MKKVKYVLLAFVLALSTVVICRTIYGSYYKNVMFTGNSEEYFLLTLKTDDSETLETLDTFLKEQSLDNFSIVIENNAKPDDLGNVYHYYSNLRHDKEKIIVLEDTDFTNFEELKTGDQKLFDPTPKHPIIIRPVNLKDTSEEASIIIYDFVDDSNVILNKLIETSKSIGLYDVFELEEVSIHMGTTTFYLLPLHTLLMIAIFLFSVFLIKDVNVDIKDVALYKLEGESNFAVNRKLVLKKILVAFIVFIPIVMVYSLYMFPLSISSFKEYYKLLVFHSIFIFVSLLILSLSASVIIYKANVAGVMKNRSQLEVSITALGILKIVVIFVLMMSSYQDGKVINTVFKNERNLNANMLKYKDYYIINSAAVMDVNQTLEIKEIQDALLKDHQGLLTICVEQEDESLSENDGLVYIKSSETDKVIVNLDMEESSQQQSMFNHYGFDKLKVEKQNLENDDFVYCPFMKGDIYSEKLSNKDYALTVVALSDLYAYDLNPSYILYKASGLTEANKIIDDIYAKKGESNPLVIQSMEAIIENDRMFAIYELKNVLIKMFMMIILLVTLNTELINNINLYNRKENMELLTLGKSKLYLARKYIYFVIFQYVLIALFILVVQFRFMQEFNWWILAVLLASEICIVAWSSKRYTFNRIKGA